MADSTPSDRSDQGNFDVSEWMRLIGEVQRFGVETARAVAGRFGDLADTDLGSRAMSAAPVDAAMSAWRSMVDQATSSTAQEQFAGAAQTLTEAFIDMMQAAWSMVTASDAAANVASFVAPTSGSVDLGSVAPGGAGGGKAFVHLGHGDLPDLVDLTIGPMTTVAGVSLAAGTITADPGSIDHPVAGRSYPVMLQVAVPAKAKPGRYHGFLFSGTEPESAVPIHLEVAGS